MENNRTNEQNNLDIVYEKARRQALEDLKFGDKKFLESLEFYSEFKPKEFEEFKTNYIKFVNENFKKDVDEKEQKIAFFASEFQKGQEDKNFYKQVQAYFKSSVVLCNQHVEDNVQRLKVLKRLASLYENEVKTYSEIHRDIKNKDVLISRFVDDQILSSDLEESNKNDDQNESAHNKQLDLYKDRRYTVKLEGYEK